MTDNLHPERSLRYSYDQARLSSVAQGTPAAPRWTQTYDYDRYGNRTALRVTAPASHTVPLDGQAATPVDEGSITSPSPGTDMARRQSGTRQGRRRVASLPVRRGRSARDRADR